MPFGRSEKLTYRKMPKLSSYRKAISTKRNAMEPAQWLSRCRPERADIPKVARWNMCAAHIAGGNRRSGGFTAACHLLMLTRRARAPRRTLPRRSRGALFSSATAAENSFHEAGVVLRRIVNFGMSQRRSERASARPTRRLAADTQHSWTRRRHRSPVEIILHA